MEGRQTGSEGHRRAAQYVAEQFERLELPPAGTDRYFQPVDFETRRLEEERSKLELSRGGMIIPLRFGQETIAQPFGVSGQPFEADMVFAGYGLTIPEYKHDDFTGLNVAGKVVFVLGGAPAALLSTVAAHYSSLEERVRNLEKLGVAGVIGVVNPRLEEIPWERLSAIRSQFTHDSELVVIRVNREKFEPITRYKVATSDTWTQPVISGNRIFVKDVSSLTLWTIDWD